MLLPTDPNDAKNVVLEIRAGTGRRRGDAVRRRAVPHVHAFRRGRRAGRSTRPTCPRARSAASRRSSR